MLMNNLSSSSVKDSALKSENECQFINIAYMSIVDLINRLFEAKLISNEKN